MAKDLPYFKFFVSEWNDGDITLEDYDTQGLFINLCAYYWSSECSITLTKAKKKFRHCPKKCFDLIIESGAVKVVGDVISINFLDEQSKERKAQYDVKSKGGKASAEIRRLKKLADQDASTPSTEGQQDSTESQHVLKSSSTEAQLLREEEKREEERRREEKKKEDKELTVYSSEVNDCFNNCLNHFPLHLHPKDSKPWIETIDKLNRIDSIPFNIIEDVVKKARNDEFWSANFLSLTKLRQKNKDGLKYIIVFNEKFKNNKDEKRNSLTEYANDIRSANPDI